MGTNDQEHNALRGTNHFFSSRRAKNRPTPFVFQWRALQHELAFKISRLDNFLTGISEIVAVPCDVPPESDGDSDAPRFRKSLAGNLIAS